VGAHRARLPAVRRVALLRSGPQAAPQTITTGGDSVSVSFATDTCTAPVSLSRHVVQTGSRQAPRHEAQVLTDPPQRLHVNMPIWSTFGAGNGIPDTGHLPSPHPGERDYLVPTSEGPDRERACPVPTQ